MLTGYIIHNPCFNNSGVIYDTFAITREACIRKWENLNGDKWRDNFPNIKCVLVEIKTLEYEQIN